MIKNLRFRPIFLLYTLIYVILLYFFYFRYVPIVKHFQLILVPILSIVFILTVLNIQWGTLFFIFSFPLINSLPYFFGIFENTPHAPTALVLFLFYFLGWLVHNTLYESKHSLKHPIFKPMVLLSILVLLSGIITFFRYANFYPLLTDYVYELITNVNGVTSGGAIMSVMFNSLNYLTGFIFFFILLNTVKSKEFIKKILIVLLTNTFVSLVFGFYQHFRDPGFGNTPFRIRHMHLDIVSINGTFKDPNSFGIYLAVIVPLFIGMTLAFKKKLKLISILVITGAFFILPYTGSLSGLLGVAVASLIFISLLLKPALDLKKSNPKVFRKVIISIGFIFIFISIVVSSFIVPKDSILFKKLKTRIMFLEKKGDWGSFSSSRLTYFWKTAAYMIRDYPFSGVGIGAYIIELPNYAELNKMPLRTSDSAENYFLQIGSELGILGLLLSLWIFWEIFKHMKKTFKIYLSTDKWKYLFIGITAAIVSFFVNFLFHTYIGSFEIKYTFWLLVGLIFILGKSDKKPEKKYFFSKNLKILSVVAIVLFSSIHLWNSTHSLSLKSRTEQFGMKQDFGLYQIEKTDNGREFRWTRKYGGMTIKIKKPVIEIPLLASHPDIRKDPVKIKIYLIKDFFKQKKLIDEIILTENLWETYEYYIPEEVNQEVILLVKVSRTWNPLRILGTPDPRNLGVAVGKIQFKER